MHVAKMASGNGTAPWVDPEQIASNDNRYHCHYLLNSDHHESDPLNDRHCLTGPP